MSIKKILIVEDDEPKLRALVEFFQESYGGARVDIHEARSHSSATKMLDVGSFDFAILDMSLPTFDLQKDTRGGGPPLGFGGRELLRLLEAEAPNTKAIVVTQYPEFTETIRGERASFIELNQQLKNEFGDQYLGMVYFAGKQGVWRSEVRTLLLQAGLGSEK